MAAQLQEGKSELAENPSTNQAPAIDDWDVISVSPGHYASSNASPAAQPGAESLKQEMHARQLSGNDHASSDTAMQADGSGLHTHSQTGHSDRAIAVLPKTLTLNTAQKRKKRESDLPSSPLLASSNGTLLSDKLADASQLLSQDTMLQNHQEEQSEAHMVGLSKGAVQTGFRAAGKVGMTDGTSSEPVTEAMEALSPVGKSPEEVTDAVDNKGRIMKVSGFFLK